MPTLKTRQRLPARKHRPDYSIVLITGLLILIGLVVIFSIGPALESLGVTVSKQFGAIILGVGAFAATALIPLNFWHKAQVPLLVIAGISSLLLLAPGGVINPEINGATRWIVVGPLSFQPSELLKFALIIYMATFLSRRVRHLSIDDKQQTLVPIAVLMGVLAVFLVLFQRDLGTMMVLVAIMLTMLFIAGMKLKYLAGLGGAIVAAGLAAILLVPERMERFLTFLNPQEDLEGAGYHINQALIAIGSGGVFGLGLGKSIQAYGYLPEAANDSIFAIYAEKFGFIGVIVTLGLFGFLLFRLVRVVEHAPNMYTRLLAAGVFAWIFAHIIINIGAMVNILPLTGITLPFLSYGGTSMVFTMLALGLVFNISRYTVYELPNEKGGDSESSRHRRRHRRSRLATNSSRL